MPTNHISYRSTNYFSSLICDYLSKKDELSDLYNRFPNLNNFKAQIEEKSTTIDRASRIVLNESLIQQYQNTKASDLTSKNIDLLKLNNTFTITTGHQLNLFTGPLYFLYKIVSVINLTEELKNAYPENNFVPVYWMATEDHDFEEINYFNFKGQKVHWSRDAKGGVGRLSTEGLDQVFHSFSNYLGHTDDAIKLKNLFKEAYIDHPNLADATRYLANALFGDYGLVIVDGDDVQLKSLLSPYVKDEFLNQTSFKDVSGTNGLLEQLNYKVQVNPREINLFYLTDNSRERIIINEGTYHIYNTSIKFSEEEILKELEAHPERFSPNALLRPLYQEVILPNLCYIGGGGELAYWFQLKSYFDNVKVTFPMLLLRNSALIITQKQDQKLSKLKLTIEDLFLNQDDLVDQYINKVSEIKIDFSTQKEHLKSQFEALYKLAEKTDKSFLGAVGAQEHKQIKGLEHLEKRLLKAQKKRLENDINRLKLIQNELFPNNSLQERNKNFSEFYLQYGMALIPKLKDALKPLIGDFSIVEL